MLTFERKESKTTVLLSRSMEAASKDLETKLTLLQITGEETDAVFASRNENRIKRHRDALCSVVASVEKAKRKVEELKIAAGEKLSAITSWGAKLDQDIAAVDLDMDGISSFLNNFDQEQIEKARNDQLAFEKELFEKKLQYTKELKSANLSDQAGSQNGKQCAALAKLPKLTITKFNGTNLDWNRFWGQFTEGIDKSEMAAITKFSYLKEFVDPKVRKCIDGLLSVQVRRDAIYAPGSTTPPSVLINNLRKTACCPLSMLRRWFTCCSD